MKIFRHQPGGRRNHSTNGNNRTCVPENLNCVLETSTTRALALWLTSTDRYQRESQVSELSAAQILQLAELLDPITGRELLESLPSHAAHHLLSKLPASTAAGLLESIDEDDGAEILRLFSDEESKQILAAMEVSHSALVRGLLSWPEETAASRMRPSFIAVPANVTVNQAIDAARADPENANEGVFVTAPTDRGQQLIGWISATDLLLAPADTGVTEVMESASEIRPHCLTPLSDQDYVHRLFQKHRVNTIPVMDNDIILGVITADMIDDVVIDETTEDAQFQGGSSPLEVPYMRASVWKLWRKRVVWLLVLFAAEMYTGTVLRSFEDELQHVVALSFFIPLLIGTGGNAGTQITTTLIRAMSTEGVRLRNVGKVIMKELGTGFLLGVTMAIAGALRAWSLGVGQAVIITVAVSLLAIVVWSSFVASVLPLLLRRIGIDPAVVSGPMISTLVDGTGLLIYFEIAKLILGL